MDYYMSTTDLYWGTVENQATYTSFIEWNPWCQNPKNVKAPFCNQYGDKLQIVWDDNDGSEKSFPEDRYIHTNVWNNGRLTCTYEGYKGNAYGYDDKIYYEQIFGRFRAVQFPDGANIQIYKNGFKETLNTGSPVDVDLDYEFPMVREIIKGNKLDIIQEPYLPIPENKPLNFFVLEDPISGNIILKASPIKIHKRIDGTLQDEHGFLLLNGNLNTIEAYGNIAIDTGLNVYIWPWEYLAKIVTASDYGNDGNLEYIGNGYYFPTDGFTTYSYNNTPVINIEPKNFEYKLEIKD